MEKNIASRIRYIKENFYRENFWAEHVVAQLDCWIAFYFQHRTFPGSQKLIAIPQVKTLPFLKTDIPISPNDLFKKFAGTDAKALVSNQGLAALNIHFGGNKLTSQQAMYEYLENLTFQALSQENDKVYMSFSEVGLLVNDLLECPLKKENEKIEKSSILGGKLGKKLETDSKAELSPELKIQKGEETEGELIELAESSIPLKTEKIEDIYNQEKKYFLKVVTIINKTDLETAVGMNEDSNKAVIDEIINLTLALIVHDTVNVDSQLDFEKNDLDTTFRLSNTLQERLYSILEQARKKVKSLKFPGEVVDEIPNDPLSAEKGIETEDFYLDDSLRQLLNPENQLYFPQPSTDDRKGFEVNVSGDELIVYKLPALTTVSIAKKDFKNSLEKIIEDLNINLTQLKMTEVDRIETRQKINIVKNFINRLDSANKQNIEKQLQTHEWIIKLIEEQLQEYKTYFTFGENFENYNLQRKDKFNSNITL